MKHYYEVKRSCRVSHPLAGSKGGRFSLGVSFSLARIDANALLVGQRHHGIVTRRAQRRINCTGGGSDKRQRDGLEDPAR
jgi:hypothetical protein